MKTLNSIIVALASFAAILFAWSNRSGVTLHFAPFPYEVSLPLYLLVLFALVLGVVIGGMTVWIGGHGVRRRARDQARLIANLEAALSGAPGRRERGGDTADRPADPPD